MIEENIGIILLKLLIASILCGVIGYEREYRQKPAGIRTNILVGIGTVLMMLVSIEIAKIAGNADSVDISRIAAAIPAGIGFIGAGSIIQSRGNVRGLTTAASIWMVAAIGMVVAVGMYITAIIATGLGMFALEILRKLPIEDQDDKN